MVNEQQNPLSSYFRGKSIYTKLPSCGHYNAPEDIEFTPDNEVEVFAMTTADELLFKSPDALLNGESVAKVIESCVPGIKHVRSLPMNDIEVLLLAIRLITYDHQIDFSSQCPECETVKEFGVDIEWLLGNMEFLEPNVQVKLDNGLVVRLKPYTYALSVKAALLAFNESKFIEMLMQEDLSDEEKASRATTSFEKAVKLTIELLANSIIDIKDGDNNLITENYEHILEWLNKTSRNDTKKIEEQIKLLNVIGIPRIMEIECDNCNHKWNTEINVDPSHFFE